MATYGGFRYAFADWVVPTYDHNGDPGGSTAVQWVGLGGSYGANLWQAGTETDAYEGYRFWWEYYPNKPQIFAGPYVSHGDLVSVEVDYNYTFAGQSYVYMANYTRGTYWSTHVSFAPDTHSAEWIDERSSDYNSGCLHPLENYGHTNWTYAQAESSNYQSNKLLPISSFDYYDVIMWQNPPSDWTLLSDPGPLGSDGKSFTDTWVRHGTGC